MAVERFMRKGITKFFWVPEIAVLTTPEVDEVTAGINITKQIAGVNGFNFANSPISTPDMDSTFTSQIGGEDTAAESSLDMYDLKTTKTIYLALAKGESGFVVIFADGLAGASPAVADKCDIWPANITSRAKMYSSDNEAAKYGVSFAITDPPVFDEDLVA